MACKRSTVRSRLAPPRLWGYSSVGRASASHAEGRRFDPGYLHQDAQSSPSTSINHIEEKSLSTSALFKLNTEICSIFSLTVYS